LIKTNKLIADRQAEEDAKAAAEAAKSDEEKAAEIQSQIDVVNAKIARLQA
jgi:hypothetical protein